MEKKTWNPYDVAAFVMVDVDPRWVYDHTCTSPNRHNGEAMARVVDILSFLSAYLWEQGVPILTVHGDTRHFYDLEPLRGLTAAVCGVYGGECVEDVAEWLEQQWDVRAIRILDATVWPRYEDPKGTPWRQLFPECQVPDWACATVEQLTASTT